MPRTKGSPNNGRSSPIRLVRRGSRQDLPPRRSSLPGPRSWDWRLPFLVELTNTGIITRACEAACISRQSAYYERRRNPVFREAWDSSIQQAVDILEAEAFRRAKIDSDALLMFLLRAHRPDVYARDRMAGGVAINQGQAVNVFSIDGQLKSVGELSDEELVLAERVLEKRVEEQ